MQYPRDRRLSYIGATYIGNFTDKNLIFEVFDEANRYLAQNDLPIRFLYLGKLEVGPGYLINIPVGDKQVKGYPLEALIEALYARLLQEIHKDESFQMRRIFGLTTFPLVSRNQYFHIYEKFLGFQQDILGMKIMVLSMKPFESEDKELMKSRIFKGVLHELGHSFELEHCPNECVMNPPSDIDDWDRRPPAYCSSCMRKLQGALTAELLLRKEKKMGR
ncbi:peptidase M54 [Thermococcus profundus]|uniref:Peptidase M54 n=1 Tax=Thermococcus profundus TaxID=49899 RepID=A0A2Z2MAL2_THEPR|nr:peptidase M54 [Thermococcus profundus]ASJ02483.1 peptidase M54 [Thermococcus profundus]